MTDFNLFILSNVKLIFWTYIKLSLLLFQGFFPGDWDEGGKIPQTAVSKGFKL